MKVSIVPIVIGAFVTVSEGMLKGLEDLEDSERVETIQTTVLLKTAKILRSVLETCSHSNSSERRRVNDKEKQLHGYFKGKSKETDNLDMIMKRETSREKLNWFYIQRK